MEDLRRKRQQVTLFLLRHGRSYTGRTTGVDGIGAGWPSRLRSSGWQLVLQEAVDTTRVERRRVWTGWGRAVAGACRRVEIAPVVQRRTKAVHGVDSSLQYPSLNVRGLASAGVGASARTVVPAAATAEIDIRTVPRRPPPRRLFDLLRRHVEAQGYHLVGDGSRPGRSGNGTASSPR